MKKRYWIYIVIFGIILLYLISQRVVLYVWANPFTETAGMRSITPIVYRINKALDNAKSFSHNEGYDYSYSFFNIYGSGFTKNNPVPNDLDTEVSIYLGEYSYDGTNGREIAQKLLEKIESFLFAFYYYINVDAKKDIRITKTAFDQLKLGEQTHDYNLNLISNALNNVINKKSYVQYTEKVFELNKEIHKVDYPYSMGYNEILLTGAPSITMFSDKLTYNKNMLKYPREISLVTEFKFNLKYKNEIIETKIIPESYFGARLNINRRFFASSAFVNRYSEKFLKKESILNDPKLYHFYRMISYKRHIGEIENMIETDYSRPNKIFKRLMQTADMVQPLLDDKTYNEICEYVYMNLVNRDMQLLNEYDNIAYMLKKLNKSPDLLLSYIDSGAIDNMYHIAQNVLKELYKRGNVDKKALDTIKEFQNTKFKQFLIAETKSDVYLDKEDKTYDNVADVIDEAMVHQIQDFKKINKYVDLFNNIFQSAGYHKLHMYWLDNRTLGYVEDDFTKGIKDFAKFAQENDLADFDYKMIKANQIPEVTLRYDLWVRNNPTPEQEANYKKLKQTFEDDRKNFKIKRKWSFAFVIK